MEIVFWEAVSMISVLLSLSSSMLAVAKALTSTMHYSID